MVDNRRYDFKTIKVRPKTHKKMIKCKAKVETQNGELISFDTILNLLIEHFENSPRR